MTSETLYGAIGGISDQYIAEADTVRRKTRRIPLRVCAVAAALCLLLGGALLSNMMGGLGNGGGFFGNGDATVYAVHREDFTPGIDSAVLAQFDDPTEVKKAYLMRTNEWFLAEDLTDFSQAVTTDVVYVVPGGREPGDSDAAFSIYSVDEAGEIHWGCTAYPPESELVPFAFSGLTYALIEHALAALEHEDYIITYAPRMDVVFIWVRNTEQGDVILAYPTRPDLLGLENGEFYTLDQLQDALTDAYHDCDDRIYSEDHIHGNGHHTGALPTGHFIHSMDCSDPDCTNAAHYHDCPSDCDDASHYHNCPTSCTVKSHGHPERQNDQTDHSHSSGHNSGHGNGHH